MCKKVLSQWLCTLYIDLTPITQKCFEVILPYQSQRTLHIYCYSNNPLSLAKFQWRPHNQGFRKLQLRLAHSSSFFSPSRTTQLGQHLIGSTFQPTCPGLKGLNSSFCRRHRRKVTHTHIFTKSRKSSPTLC